MFPEKFDAIGYGFTKIGQSNLGLSKKFLRTGANCAKAEVFRNYLRNGDTVYKYVKPQQRFLVIGGQKLPKKDDQSYFHSQTF